MIAVSHLTKRFPKATAIDDISFTVEQGEIVGFLGPNGAGKSTTMRVLAGYLPPTHGEARIATFDVVRDSLEVRRRIGYLPENAPLYREMRVREYLLFRAQLKCGLSRKACMRKVEEAMSFCDVAAEADAVIGKLSRGWRQRVALADALVNDPPVLLLDEPTLGLDPNQNRHIRNLIAAMAGRKTVLLSTHILPEVHRLCDRVLIMNGGKLVASGTAAGLARLMNKGCRVIAELRGPAEAIADKLRGIRGVTSVSTQTLADGWARFTCDCISGEDVRDAVFNAAAAAGWSLRELRLEMSSLEDAFAEMTAN